MIHCVYTVRLRIGTRSGGSCVKPRGRPTPRGHWIHEGMHDRCQRQQGPVPAHSVILCACQRQPPSNPAPQLEGTIGSGTTWSAAWLRRSQHCSRPDDRHCLLGLMEKRRTSNPKIAGSSPAGGIRDGVVQLRESAVASLHAVGGAGTWCTMFTPCDEGCV